MSTQILKASVSLTIGGISYAVQNAAVSYTVDSCSVAVCNVAPSKRKTSDYKFSMSEIVEEIDQLIAFKQNGTPAVLKFYVKDLGDSGNSDRSEYTVLKGYVSSAGMVASVGSLGISVQLISELSDLYRGTAKYWTIPKAFFSAADPFFSNSQNADVFERFRLTCRSMNTVSKQSYGYDPNGFWNAMASENEVALARLESMKRAYTKFKTATLAGQSSSQVMFATEAIKSTPRIWDSLMTWNNAFGLQVSTIMENGSPVYYVTPALAGINPYTSADGNAATLELNTISKLDLSAPPGPPVRGVLMLLGRFEGASKLELTKTPWLSAGTYLDPSMKIGGMIEIPSPWWLRGSIKSSTGNQNAKVKEILTPNNAAGNFNGMTGIDSAAALSAKKASADAYCKFVYYYAKFKDRSFSGTGKINLQATAGRCYNIQYSDDKGKKKLIGFLASCTHEIAVGPQPNVQTSYQFTHLRGESESCLNISDLPLYEN